MEKLSYLSVADGWIANNTQRLAILDRRQVMIFIVFNLIAFGR